MLSASGEAATGIECDQEHVAHLTVGADPVDVRVVARGFSWQEVPGVGGDRDVVLEPLPAIRCAAGDALRGLPEGVQWGCGLEPRVSLAGGAAPFQADTYAFRVNGAVSHTIGAIDGMSHVMRRAQEGECVLHVPGPGSDRVQLRLAVEGRNDHVAVGAPVSVDVVGREVRLQMAPAAEDLAAALAAIRDMQAR